MKILFIDDQPEVVESARIAVEGFNGEKPKVKASFVGAEEYIDSYRPDIVVLDLLRASTGDGREPDGLGPLEGIWQKQLMPVVIYSAAPERSESVDSAISDHPLIRLVKKGDGSEVEVVEAIRNLIPVVTSLQATRSMVEQSLFMVLKAVAPTVFKNFSDNDDVAGALERASMRRLAAMADEQGKFGDRHAAWEQYVFPPLSNDVMLGDVLRIGAEADLDPANFRVVLTPSCDLVAGGDRSAKVD